MTGGGPRQCHSLVLVWIEESEALSQRDDLEPGSRVVLPASGGAAQVAEASS